MKHYEEVVNEIIKRVNENEIPLEDGEFTINGEVYTTADLDINHWMTTFMGVTFNEYQRIVICKVMKIDEEESKDLNVYIAQKQIKLCEIADKKTKYTYGDAIRVRPSSEQIVCAGWVKA